MEDHPSICRRDVPFTVFAPTDAAFAKLPKGTVEDLLKPENKGKLVKIVTCHVVPGRVTAADVVNLPKAKTVEGSEAKITVKKGKEELYPSSRRMSTDRESQSRVELNGGGQFQRFARLAARGSHAD